METVQLNAIEFHTWNKQWTGQNDQEHGATDFAFPDRLLFDLDPGKGVTWKSMQEAAILLHALLKELKLNAFLKTSGGKGLHIDVPITPEFDWNKVKATSKAIVDHIAKTIPSRFVAKSGPANRVGKIFVDYLRNGFGATTVCAWSLRAREGMGVSVPLTWDELENVPAADYWNITNFMSRTEVGNGPWKDYGYSSASIKSTVDNLKVEA